MWEREGHFLLLCAACCSPALLHHPLLLWGGGALAEGKMMIALTVCFKDLVGSHMEDLLDN